MIGVVLSLLLLIWRSSKPAMRSSATIPTTDAYLDPDRHEGLRPSPGVLIVRVDGPLFFADANRFRTTFKNLADRS